MICVSARFVRSGNNSGRPKRIGTTTQQLPSEPCALKTTIDYEFVMIIDSFIKWWDREQMLGHILMQWINSIPFIIRWIKWRKIEFQSGKMRSIRNGAYAIRDAISHSIYDCTEIYLHSKPRPTRQRQFELCIYWGESEEESGQEIGVNECKYSLDASWVCMCVWLIVAGAEFEKQTQKAETNRQRDRQPKQYDWEIRLCF